MSGDESGSELRRSSDTEYDPGTLWYILRSIEHETTWRDETCAFCVQFKAEEIIRRHERYFSDNDKQGFRDIVKGISCWLCRFLSRILARTLSQATFTHCYLQNLWVVVWTSPTAFRSKFMLKPYMDLTGNECTLSIIVVPDPTSSGQTSQELGKLLRILTTIEPKYDQMPRRSIQFPLKQKYIHIDLAKAWLHHCETRHQNTCFMPPLSTNHDYSTIYLIDVHTRAVNLAVSNARYVALSYVWGSRLALDTRASVQEDVEGRAPVINAIAAGYIPYDIPQTIEDAMQLVKSLGETFLWVDLYCIHQDDPLQKQRQIEQMNLIYAGAILTICALSSETAHSGIAGISRPTRDRTQTSCETATARYLATSSQKLFEHMDLSAWSSRAWTFQEGILSRRRLCFHEEGVFLLCQEEIYDDILKFEDNEARPLTKPTISNVYYSALGFSPYNQDGWKFSNYVRLVQAYNGRKLSFQSDAHNAVAGILKYMQNTMSLDFICALPDKDMFNALLWSNCPYRGYKNGRREMFPSWSWIGWDSHVEYGIWLIPPIPLHAGHEKSTRFLNRLYSVVDMKTLYRNIVKLEKLAAIQVKPFKSDKIARILDIFSDIATFPVRWIPRPGGSSRDWNEIWELHDRSGNAFTYPESRDYGFNRDDFVQEKYLTKTFKLLLPYELSVRLRSNGTTELEFLLLQHWTQNNSGNISKEEYEGTESLDNLERSGNFRDRIWALAITRRPDGIAERLALIWLTAEVWFSMNPQPAIVQLG